MRLCDGLSRCVLGMCRITDGPATLCSVLPLSIGNYQGMGDVEYDRSPTSTSLRSPALVTLGSCHSMTAVASVRYIGSENEDMKIAYPYALVGHFADCRHDVLCVLHRPGDR